MENIIIECLEDRFAKDDYILPYSWDTDESLYDVLSELFHTYEYDDGSFSIETETCFDSPGYTCGYCAIAWACYDKVKTYNFKWEVM